MRIPPEILECVAFLFYKNMSRENAYEPVGTAFFVSIAEKEYKHLYLVTAKHCLDEVRKYGAENIYVRINTRGGVEYIEVTKNERWYFHPDNDDQNPVDVAVIQIPINPQSYKIGFIDSRMFLKSEDVRDGNVGIGDDAFITGIFSKYYGHEKKNLPIIRLGSIAMFPADKVETKVGFLEAYLIEMRSVGGTSGSPVFFREPHFREDRGQVNISPNYYLGGMIQGHYGKKDKEEEINMGIAIVTPATKILETLNHPEFQKARASWSKQLSLNA